ncbi:MAG: FAD-dependent oxidoreductase [Pseudomonadota bacterium]
MADVAIAGAGVLGSAIAWRMAQAGHRVRVFDPTPGGLASPGSFAWLNASMAEDPVYNRLRHDSLSLWEALKANDPTVPVKFPGAILWEQDHFDLDAIAGSQSDLGRPAQMLDDAELADREPDVSNLPERALLAGSDGYGDPEAITAWFLDQAKAAGAELIHAGITAINHDDARLKFVTAADQSHPADYLILAVGTKLPAMLALVEEDLTMNNTPGLLARTSPGQGQITSMLATPNVHIWQREDQGYLIGADFGGGPPIEDMDAGAEDVLQKLQSVLAGTEDCRVENITVRERPMPADGRPAIGPLGPEGLYVVSTHSGMTLAPVIAEMVTAEIGGQPDARLDPYRPGRQTLQKS